MPKNRYPTISQGGDGQWHAWMSVRRPDGTSRQRHIKRATKEAVEQVVDDLLDKKKAGAPIAAGRAPTFETWFDETYLTTIAPLTCDLTTITGMRNKLRRYAY